MEIARHGFLWQLFRPFVPMVAVHLQDTRPVEDIFPSGCLLALSLSLPLRVPGQVQSDTPRQPPIVLSSMMPKRLAAFADNALTQPRSLIPLSLSWQNHAANAQRGLVQLGCCGDTQMRAPMGFE